MDKRRSLVIAKIFQRYRVVTD